MNKQIKSYISKIISDYQTSYGLSFQQYCFYTSKRARQVKITILVKNSMWQHGNRVFNENPYYIETECWIFSNWEWLIIHMQRHLTDRYNIRNLKPFLLFSNRHFAHSWFDSKLICFYTFLYKGLVSGLEKAIERTANLNIIFS
jgi:hypothetical protein